MTLCDINCLYSETQVMLKLARRARGHFMTLIEIRVHLIRCKPGHICLLPGHTAFTWMGSPRGCVVALVSRILFDIMAASIVFISVA